jgi:hypothetical protein
MRYTVDAAKNKQAYGDLIPAEILGPSSSAPEGFGELYDVLNSVRSWARAARVR